MKVLTVLLATLAGLYAHADTKLGNVIAVEREVTNIYSQCIEKVENRADTRSFYTCVIRFATTSEVQIGNSVVRLKTESCDVNGDALKGSMLFTFAQASGVSTFEDSANCLQQALQANGPVKVKLFTIE